MPFRNVIAVKAKKRKTVKAKTKAKPKASKAQVQLVGPYTGADLRDMEIVDRIKKLERAVLVLVRTCDHLLKSRHTHAPAQDQPAELKPEQAR